VDLINFIERGTTDEQAEQMLAAHQRAMTPSGFIRQRGRRRYVRSASMPACTSFSKQVG